VSYGVLGVAARGDLHERGVVLVLVLVQCCLSSGEVVVRPRIMVVRW
jgi:hypothetical protein